MDIHRVDLNLLVVFDAVVQERSVTRAARRVGLSQPAMSAALQRLRTLVGDELFVRGPRGMLPTARAQELATPVAEVLARISGSLGLGSGFDPASAVQRFVIGTNDYVSSVLLPVLLDRLATAAPHVDVGVRNAWKQGIVELLDDGDVDLAIGDLGLAPPARILTEPWMPDGFTCVVRADHPAAAGPDRPLDLASYTAFPHVLVSVDGEPVGPFDGVLAGRGKRRRVVVTVPRFLEALAAVARSSERHLIATVPRRLANAFAPSFGLVSREPPVNVPPLELPMVWHRRSDASPALRWLREQLREIAREVEAA